jgi:hypothetical protein
VEQCRLGTVDTESNVISKFLKLFKLGKSYYHVLIIV